MGTTKAGPKSSLSAKQQAFVAAYLRTRNATEAAREAGYKSPAVEGCRLLKNAKVAAIVAKEQVAATERTRIDLDYVLRRLAIEAEREDDKATHSARVAALGHLRQHFDSQGGAGTEDAPALNITIRSAAPIGDVRVTRSDG